MLQYILLFSLEILYYKKALQKNTVSVFFYLPKIAHLIQHQSCLNKKCCSLSSEARYTDSSILDQGNYPMVS